MTTWFQHQQQITVPGNNTATYTLPVGRTPLEKLTLWLSSGGRQLADLTAQVQINGKNFGTPTSFVASAAADFVYTASGANEQVLIPVPNPNPRVPVDAFNFTLLLTNANATPVKVTVYAVAIEHSR